MTMITHIIIKHKSSNRNTGKSHTLQRLTSSIFTYLFILILSGCNYTKYLPEGKALLLENSISYQNINRIQQKERITEGLLELASPKPNLSLGLGIKPKLWLYNIGGEPKKRKSLQGFIKYKLGEPPVAIDTFRSSRATLRMEKYLQDEGYLNSYVTYEENRNNRKGNVNYLVNTQGSYKVESIFFPTGSELLYQIIQDKKDESYIKEGNIYRLNDLERERKRISYELRKEGYYEFSKDYIYYLVDSTSQSQQVKIDLRIKAPINSEEHQIYTVRNIFITPDYFIDSIFNPVDTLFTRKYILTKLTKTKTVDTATLNQLVLIRSGDRFSERFNEFTINHFLNLGIFKYVEIDYQKVGDQQLDCFIRLTPSLNQTITLDLEGDTRTGTLFNGFGISLSNTYTNRNIFRGGEEFNVNLQAGIVIDPSDSSAFINSLDAGIQVGLSVPRFLVPFQLYNVSSYYVPTTNISARIRYQQRVNFYTLGDAGLSFGYEWNENSSVGHQLTPIAVEFINLLQTSEAFDSTLNANPFLQLSFNDVLVVGPRYAFTYNQQQASPRSNYSYFRGSLDFSGNILNGIYRIFKDTENGPFELLGQPFAQFTRIDAEFRHYFPLDRRRMLVGRIFSGVGFAYGNSDILPFVKQYFIGGPNSIRAFPIRQLGPGNFRPNSEDGSVTSFVDQSGEFVLETNLEYRFDLVSTFLEGALFIDAGNIWLINNQLNEDLSPNEKNRQESGLLRLDSFARQIAIGTGFGLRLDFSFFILRADIAFPLRDPGEQRGFEWVIDDIRPLSTEWREENLQLNIAIGYPF